MTPLHTLNVFTAPDGSSGNPLGVFLDGPAIAAERRQAIAADLGYSETVFVDDRETGALEIYTPRHPLPFAGHPLVGTAWLLGQTRSKPPTALHPPIGAVATWVEDGATWIRGRAEWAPDFHFIELESPAQVAALRAAPDGVGDGYCWAWEDEAAGHLRARHFLPSLGIPEDPATGAAAVALASELGRSLRITQGEACRLHARLGPDGTAEVGGTVRGMGTREYPSTGTAARST
jgi:predicted PhzF superfamily epimerase YddE/YHI9